jgi:hypothetical protein
MDEPPDIDGRLRRLERKIDTIIGAIIAGAAIYASEYITAAFEVSQGKGWISGVVSVVVAVVAIVVLAKLFEGKDSN